MGWEYAGRYSTELYTERAQRIITQHDKTKPLFLYMPFQTPHSANPGDPLQVPERYFEKLSHIKHVKRRKYAGMVSVLDDAVGNVTQTLHQEGMLENTIIVFSSDNGGPTNGFNYNSASNYPLRGVKSMLWEGGTRAAAFVWSPLLKKSGYVSNHMMHVTDWLPTLVGRAAGQGQKCEVENKNLDGIDLWDTLSNNADVSPRTEFVYNIDAVEQERNYPGPHHAIRVGDMKLIYGNYETGRYGGWVTPPGLTTDDPIPEHLLRSEKMEEILIGLGRGEVTSHPAVVHCGEKPSDAASNCQVNKSPCLYNITADPCEYNNLASTMPETLATLQAKLRGYQESMVEPRNQLPDSAGRPIYHGGVWGPWVNLGENDFKGESAIPPVNCHAQVSDTSMTESKPPVNVNGESRRNGKRCRDSRQCKRCRRCGKNRRCKQSRQCRWCKACQCN